MIEHDRETAIASWSAMSTRAMAALDPDGDAMKKHLLNPAVFRTLEEHLGDLRGRRVLDAGAGQGYFSRLLAGRGAQVTAVEPASGLIGYSQAREAESPLGVEHLQADLVDVALEPVFDAVVANMVFLSIPDWTAALQTCVGALRPGGVLVFSVNHPCFEEGPDGTVGPGRHYTEEYVMSRPTAPDFHRPLSSYLNAVIDLGCQVTRIVEPVLDERTAADEGLAGQGLTGPPPLVVIAAVRRLQ